MILQLLLISIFSITPALAEDSISPNAEEVIIDMALESIQKNYSEEEFRFQISPRWIPSTLHNIHPKQIKAVDPRGAIQKYTSFEVVYLQSQTHQKIEIQLKIAAEQKVPVLKERKLQGETISEDDFKLQWIAVDLDRDSPITDLTKLAGKTLRRSMKAGQFISDGMISQKYVVEAGEVVNMIYTENGFLITLSCESRKNGAKGEEIQIYCKETRKKYLGKILGPGEIAWLKTY